MSDDQSWAWAALFLMGAYHGVNPGMGWLFAVALGLQDETRKSVIRSLIPIALGHGAAIALTLTLAGLLRLMLPLGYVKAAIALTLFAFGVYKLARNRHPRWGGMQVGFVDLSIWSFLMASAHGAGFMVLPVQLLLSAQAAAHHPSAGPMEAVTSQGSWTNVAVLLVHTLGYLLVTGVVALLVYEKLGLALLRKAWFNLDLIWAAALILTGAFTLVI